MMSEEEKELRSKQRAFMDTAKDIVSKFGETESRLKGDVKELLGNLSSEVKKLQNPIAKKDTEVNGKKIYVSLVEDSRVMFHFSAQQDARDFYNQFMDVKTRKEYVEEFFRLGGLIKKYKAYLSLPFYKRIFAKNPIK